MGLEKPDKLKVQPQVDAEKLKENRDQRSIVMARAEHRREAQKNGETIVYDNFGHLLGKSELPKQKKAKVPDMKEGFTYRAVGGVDATVFDEKKIDRGDLRKLAGWAKKFPELYLVEKKIISNFDTLKEETNQTEILDIIIEIGEIATEVESSKFDLKKFTNILGKYPYELVYGPQGAFNILLAMDRAAAAVKDKKSENVIYDLRIGNKKLSQASRFTELRSKFEIKEVQTPVEVMDEAEKNLDAKKDARAKVEAIFDRKTFDKNVAEFFSGNYLKDVRPECYVAKDSKGTYEGGLVINDAKYIVHTKKEKYFVYPSGGKMGTVELKVIKEVSNNKFELVTIAEILTGDLSSEESKKNLANQIVEEIEKQEGGESRKKVLERQAEKDRFVGDLGQSLDALGAAYSEKYGFEVKFKKVVEKNGDVVFMAKVKNKSGLERSFYARVVSREGSPKISLSPVSIVGDEFYDSVKEGLDALKVKMDFKLDGMKGFDKDKSEGEAETQKKNFLAELNTFFNGNYLGGSVQVNNHSDGVYQGGVEVKGSMCSLSTGNELYFVYPDVTTRTIALKIVSEIKPNQFGLVTLGKISVDNLRKNIEIHELDDVASRGFADKLKGTLDDYRGRRS